MPGLQGDTVVAALGSPVKKNKLSLKFFHKKEAKRALDFSEPQPQEVKKAESVDEEPSSCDQVVPGPSPYTSSPSLLPSLEKKETLVPFVGFNNLGNTCYLNSVLQVLYHCPGLREGLKILFSLSKNEKIKDEGEKNEETEETAAPAHINLLWSFNNLITSAEQLQASFLFNPDGFSEGDLATPPRKMLNTLRQLNPMYEGYLQHDAQEVLQCILGYLLEACETIKKEHESEKEKAAMADVNLENAKGNTGEDGQVNGKRKSDTEAGNAKKKPKSVRSKTSDGEEDQFMGIVQTRSKRKSSDKVPFEAAGSKDEEVEESACTEETKQLEEDNGESGKSLKETDVKRKKKAKLGWLRPSRKQPSIFSKFRSVGRISSTVTKNQEKSESEDKEEESTAKANTVEDSTMPYAAWDLMEQLFQGQLVLRTRCLECESFTERREDFQDISVPVLDEEPSSPEDLSEISPDPKPELKTLNWAIGQFASVEHIFGEDKYFCETCRHYTEAERSLLFDKTPEVVTIHLKRFSANTMDLDLYSGLSKVNTPLQTPLNLCLDEWCTRRSARGQNYSLFAVVMHSGVTISSGHYTAYVRMSDLRDIKVLPPPDQETPRTEETDIKSEKKNDSADHDDDEVSIPRAQRAGTTTVKKVSKKVSEGGVGLLGGQRSLSACEISGKQEKAEGNKRRKTLGHSSELTKGQDSRDGGVMTQGNKAAEMKALNGLLEYEGKWMLFDDSEVRMFDEEDFLRACSPETSSSSTPYLLFYKRTAKQ